MLRPDRARFRSSQLADQLHCGDCYICVTYCIIIIIIVNIVVIITSIIMCNS